LTSVLGAIIGLWLFALVLFFNRQDLLGVSQVLRQAPIGIGITILVHVPQLVLTALAWWTLLPRTRRPAVITMVGLRWIRESLTALIPAGAIIGQSVAAQRLARVGVSADLAGATAIVDITMEGATQALVTVVGLILLFVVRGDRHLASIAVIGTLLTLGATAAMVTLQRNLPLRLVETALARLVPRWSALKAGWLADLQQSILRVHAGRRTLVQAAICHLGAWTLGAVEVSGLLYLLGRPVSLADGFVVESLTQALRSAAFMIPGGLGVQEGAIVASCGLVGVPADAALMLALLRRAREVLLGVPGLFAVRRLRSTIFERMPLGSVIDREIAARRSATDV
jgi:putative membrane protein